MAATSKLQGFIDRYGPAAGPKLYHALQSRAAYIGANTRRRKTIAGLTGAPTLEKRPDRPAEPQPTPLLLDADH